MRERERENAGIEIEGAGGGRMQFGKLRIGPREAARAQQNNQTPAHWTAGATCIERPWRCTGFCLQSMPKTIIG